MSDAILFSIIQNIIENLQSENFQEIGSVCGVEAELEKINNAVSEIKFVVQDAAERQIQNVSVRLWLDDLSDVIYEVDDWLSEFSTEALQRRVTSEQHIKKKVRTLFFFSSSNSSSFSREMGRKLMEIRKKLTAIVNDGKHFLLKERLVESTRDVSSMLNREFHAFVCNDDVIGREDDKRAIIKLLLEPNVKKNVSVIPIVGLGGLGKTTLVEHVYNDEIVRNYFEIRLWVCVSDPFNVKLIIENILMAGTGRLLANLAMDQLESQFRKMIEQKKYLLVLDDVWNEDPIKWDILKSFLMGGAKGSKIVITTRSEPVARITNPVLVYTLGGLSEGQSWSLFKRVAFSRNLRHLLETNNDKLETIGREIAHKCQGNPLAIKTLGKLLYHMEHESEWIHVRDNLSRNVISDFLRVESDILSLLRVSYDHLPSHLKACFAFCSLFPKDYAIDKETLIQLWIAQGLIRPSNKNIQLEDVANDYFNGLLWRAFFQEHKSLEGKFIMHDLIHDLAQEAAGAKCKAISLDDNNIDETICHVSFPFYVDSSFTNTLSLLVKTAKIRTILLTFREYRSGVSDASMLNTIILSLKSLRALDLHGLKIARVPNSIDKLILLKYLDLSFNNKLTFLPESITRLRNLQTLKLSCCWSLKELPKDIGELVNLEHLCNIGCEGLNQMPLGFGEITSLRTLSLFVVHKDSPSISRHVGGLEELYHLNNLKGTLEIKILERLKDANLESKGANLKEKRHLERLRLKWYNVVYDGEESLKGLQPHQNLKYLTIIGYAGVRISSWLSSLTNLVDLSLERCKKCRYLPPLSLLPSLGSIHLLDMNGLEYISDDISEEVPASLAASKIFFPSLKSLTIDKCANLKGWWRRRDFVEEVNNDNDSAVATSASMLDHYQHQHQLLLPLFPCLSSLYVNNSPKLTSMPLFPYLEECLCLNNVSLKPLRLTMAATSFVPSTSSSSSSPPLSKLKSMTLELIKDIEYLPNEWVSNLTSLQSLKILKCPELTSLFGEMQYLTSLRNLEINNCEKFDPFTENYDGMELQALNCLRSLTFEGVPKLKLLPPNLQYVTSLQELKISKCPNLMIMPSWIGKLTSLEQLEILTCPNLTSLPDGICGLSSLQKLRIAGCPFLEERCHKEIGDDWHKIAHIQDVSIEL